MNWQMQGAGVTQMQVKEKSMLSLGSQTGRVMNRRTIIAIVRADMSQAPALVPALSNFILAKALAGQRHDS